MNPRLVVTIGCTFASVVGSTSNAHACGCGGSAPSPAAFRASAVVFVGQVSAVSRPVSHSSQNPDGSVSVAEASGPTLITFQVARTYRGVGGRQVVLTGRDSSCDFLFASGETWLVYAIWEGGSLTTHKCLRTRLAAAATEDLKYLDGLASGRAQGVVHGIVFRRMTMPDGSAARGALAETLDVIAAGAGRRFSAKTDRWGPFQIVLPPGEFEVWAERDGRIVTAPTAIRILIGDERELSLTAEFP